MSKSLHDSTTEQAPRSRSVWLVASVAATATPIVTMVAGLDHLVLARLATNHNEVAATDA
jgi:hypothetical protein